MDEDGTSMEMCFEMRKLLDKYRELTLVPENKEKRHEMSILGLNGMKMRRDCDRRGIEMGRKVWTIVNLKPG